MLLSALRCKSIGLGPISHPPGCVTLLTKYFPKLPNDLHLTILYHFKKKAAINNYLICMVKMQHFTQLILKAPEFAVLFMLKVKTICDKIRTM